MIDIDLWLWHNLILGISTYQRSKHEICRAFREWDARISLAQREAGTVMLHWSEGFLGVISATVRWREKNNPRLPFQIYREQPFDNTNQLYISIPHHTPNMNDHVMQATEYNKILQIV